MFKKLRNRFLILNLVIISFMMLIAFASIYFITYKNVRTDIDMELHRISEFNHKPDENQGQLRPDQASAEPAPADNTLQKRPEFDYSQPAPKSELQQRPERSMSFSLITDNQWNITDISSIFDMDSEFYENAKKAAFSQNKDTGYFKLDDNHWAYMIKHALSGYRIVFLDITSQQGILINLIYTFFVVAFVMLIFIFFISRFFANKSIKPVKNAFEKQKQFIADASHELKTPIAVINTNVDVLLANGEDIINNQSKWLHYIKSESERMTKLTNDLLYLTQMDYSDAKVIYNNFNLSELVESVILTMEAIIFESNIKLNYDVESNLTVQGNSEQIRQVVMILLDNALKYTNEKGTVDFSLKKRHNEIVLTVNNTGEGIPEEYLEKIFDRFYRTDKSRTRQHGGYGLGLAIARAIIEQHGGKIYAKSVVSESTTFYVELPCVMSSRI